MIPKVLASVLLVMLLGCAGKQQDGAALVQMQAMSGSVPLAFDTSATVIHLLVALCDNQYQGIVPVPSAIGNGQDPRNNLYWGCRYGVRTYFGKSANWKLMKAYAIDSVRLERVILKHNTTNAYLVADAYNGKYIKDCTIDLLRSCAGQRKDTVQLHNTVLGVYGDAAALAYIGHDGLMDFTLKEDFSNADGKRRDAFIFACMSKQFFADHLRHTKANPVVWSTGLMSPEAYSLHDALNAWLGGEPPAAAARQAAKAYARFQKCGEQAAAKLLVSGY